MSSQQRKGHPGWIVFIALLLFAVSVAAQVPEERKRTLISGYPIAFFSPETSLAIGGGGAWTLRTDTIDGKMRSSNLQGYMVYTLKNQVLVQFPFEFFPGNWFFSGELDYFDFPYKFHGLGDTICTTDHEWYEARFFRTGLDAYRRLGKALYAGPRVWSDHYIELVPEANSTLLEQDVIGNNGGSNLGLGLGLLLDRRNDLFYTTRGTYTEVAFLRYGRDLGSDFDFSTILVDLRAYLQLHERNVLSFQLYGEFQEGKAPFHLLTQLGGNRVQRGYYQGQYRDANLVSAQVEYKHFFLPRWGFALFAGAGTVWGARTFGSILPTGGIGVRFVLDRRQRMNIRVDQAFGLNSTGTYITVREAF